MVGDAGQSRSATMRQRGLWAHRTAPRRRAQATPGITLASAEHVFPYRYPTELEEWVALKSGRRVLMRPIRPGDVDKYQDMFSKVDSEDIRFRFFQVLRNLPASEVTRFRSLNYDRAIDMVASGLQSCGCPEFLGIIQAFTDVERSSVEFGLLVRSDQKGQGLGKLLLAKVVSFARRRGFRQVIAEVMPGNAAMLGLASSLGFKETLESDGEMMIRLNLR